MLYFVNLDLGRDAARRSYSVDVTDLPNGALEVRLDGLLIEVDAVAAGSQLSVRVAGRVVDLTTDGAPPEMVVIAGGQRTPVRVESERARSANLGGKREVGGAEKVVRSPMPGRVVRVLVAEGEAVQAGQGLVVLEAMKMENEVRARSAGVVAEVHVMAGETVEGSARLVTFD
jgi:biotin carboxyl carrier protein